MKISLIIPAYNEEKRIYDTLSFYMNYFKKKYDKYEILVIANGCKDNTVSIVEDLKRKDNNLYVKDFPDPIGKGGALIEGFKIATGDLIGFVDADNSSKPEVFNDLVEAIKGNDGVIASRYINGSKIIKKQPISRRIASRVFNLISRILFKLPFSDTQCGCKLFTKKSIKDVTPMIGITNWAFDINLLYFMKKKGYKIIEITTTWEEAEGSHLNVSKTSPEMLLAVIRLRMLYSPFRFIVKSYDWVINKIKND